MQAWAKIDRRKDQVPLFARKGLGEAKRDRSYEVPVKRQRNENEQTGHFGYSISLKRTFDCDYVS